MTLTLNAILLLLLIGIAVGIVSGMLGIGGAIMIIPILTLFFGIDQKLANGTSLAMLLPPIGIFAVMTYHRAGNIDWKVAMLLAAGFALGAWLGSILVNTGRIPQDKLRLMFVLLLLYVAGRILFRADGRALAALQTCGLMVAFFASYLAMRLLGRKWKKMPYWASIYQDRARLPTQHDYEI